MRALRHSVYLDRRLRPGKSLTTLFSGALIHGLTWEGKLHGFCTVLLYCSVSLTSLPAPAVQGPSQRPSALTKPPRRSQPALDPRCLFFPTFGHSESSLLFLLYPPRDIYPPLFLPPPTILSPTTLNAFKLSLISILSSKAFNYLISSSLSLGSRPDNRSLPFSLLVSYLS